ncbi:MAG: hypothetical protein EBS05_08860 [Proteobacteria bacterium]|nr:hypothetical protein [Pseudomonadota bacterium]
MLTGRLVDPEGKAIVGAKLIFEASERRVGINYFLSGRSDLSTSRESAKTDARGIFRLPFSKTSLELKGLEDTGHWLEPNQWHSWGWRATWGPSPGSVPDAKPVFSWQDTDIGDVLAYPFLGEAELASVKESPANTTTLHDEETVDYDWTTGAFAPPGAKGPRLSIALRLFQERGFPPQVRVTFRGVQAELWAGDNELPYAPADHYERGLMCFATATAPKPVNFFLYLRASAPTRYARIAVTYDWRKHQLTCAARHNTTGARLISSPRFVPASPYAALGIVRNIRVEWWVELDLSMTGQGRYVNPVPLFDADRAVAAFREHSASFKSSQPVPNTPRSALEHLARNPTVPVPVLQALQEKHWGLVERHLCGNPAMPTALLQAIASTNRIEVGRAIEKNLNQTEDRRRFLRGD